jgi:SAM-dependent methyltransferase
MDPSHAPFYTSTLKELLRRNTLSLDSRILVACAAKLDKLVFQELGFTNVIMSNLDTRAPTGAFAPFEWHYEDVENLTYPDDSFDFCIVHLGLHHCQSPHKGLLELYRVSRNGVLVVEPCDNFTTRVGVWLGFGQDYEIASVADDGWRNGGFRNTSIPNYIYRWSAREVIKTISTYAPHTRPRFLFFYSLCIPWLQLRLRRNKLPWILMSLAAPFLYLLTFLFPSESNNFAFVTLKPPPESLHPWLKRSEQGPEIDREYVEQVLFRGRSQEGRVPGME